MSIDTRVVNILQQQIDAISVVSHERAVLANVFSDTDLIYETQLALEPDDFSSNINRNIFEIMLSIADGQYDSIQKITPFIIQTIASVNGVEIGGEEYLRALETTRVSRENFRFSVDKVKYASIRRKTAAEGLNVIDDCIDSSDGDVDEFTARQENRFIDLTLSSKGIDRVVQIGEEIDEDLNEYVLNDGDIEGYPTGYDELDAEIGGVIPGEVTIVGAFAKTGKSALLLNIAKNLACNPNEPVPVLYIDTELNTKKQRSRLLSILSNVPERTIRRGLYTHDSNLNSRVLIASEIIKNIPLYHVHLTDFTVEKVVNLVRKYVKQKGVKVLIFDYIKLPDNANGKFQEHQELGIIASALKNKIASNMDIGVITAMQLNRGSVNMKELDAGSLGGSLKPLQFCDNLLFLRNKTNEEMAEDGMEMGNQELSLGYARNGGEYKGWINYRRKTLTMEEVRNAVIRTSID